MDQIRPSPHTLIVLMAKSTASTRIVLAIQWMLKCFQESTAPSPIWLITSGSMGRSSLILSLAKKARLMGTWCTIQIIRQAGSLQSTASGDLWMTKMHWSPLIINQRSIRPILPSIFQVSTMAKSIKTCFFTQNRFLRNSLALMLTCAALLSILDYQECWQFVRRGKSLKGTRILLLHN